jgi:hypothetical protein
LELLPPRIGVPLGSSPERPVREKGLDGTELGNFSDTPLGRPSVNVWIVSDPRLE